MKGCDLMNINPTMNIGFKATPPTRKVTKLFIPAKDGVMRCEIHGTIMKKNNITMIKYDILQKGNVLEKKNFKNNEGFDRKTLEEIDKTIQEKIKEGLRFLEELVKAQI